VKLCNFTSGLVSWAAHEVWAAETLLPGFLVPSDFLPLNLFGLKLPA
jgi:hypothetical protein